jgi:hypothetical protein
MEVEYWKSEKVCLTDSKLRLFKEYVLQCALVLSDRLVQANRHHDTPLWIYIYINKENLKANCLLKYKILINQNKATYLQNYFGIHNEVPEKHTVSLWNQIHHKINTLVINWEVSYKTYIHNCDLEIYINNTWNIGPITILLNLISSKWLHEL